MGIDHTLGEAKVVSIAVINELPQIDQALKWGGGTMQPHKINLHGLLVFPGSPRRLQPCHIRTLLDALKQHQAWIQPGETGHFLMNKDRIDESWFYDL